MPLKLSVRVARLAYELGMKELTQAILITKHPKRLSPEELVICLGFLRVALKIRNMKFIDWYFNWALNIVDKLSIIQDALIFHIAVKARPSHLISVLKARLFSHVSRFMCSPSEV